MNARAAHHARKSALRNAAIAIALTASIAAATTIAAPAEAADGYCGYYSETRAVNSKSDCRSKKLASYIKVDGKLIYAPWALTGQTSWQRVNYASVQAYDYIFRPV